MATRTIFRHRLLAAVLLTLLALVGFGALSADGAAAARYTVAQCGWHVGHDAGWFDTSADKFVRSSYCQTPPSADGFDGVHLTSETRGSIRSVGGTNFARWRWQAPPGTGIVTVHGQRWHVLKDAFEHRIGSAPAGGGFEPFAEFRTTDTVRRDFSHAFSPYAVAVESRLLCARPGDKSCDASDRSVVGVRGLTITLDDSSVPTASISGELTGSGWLRGTRGLNFSDGDYGSGLRYAQTSIDGAVRGHTELACSKAFIAGQWRATVMKPCAGTGSGVHAVATETLSDGPHQLHHCAIDFAGSYGCTPARTVRVDNNPPTAPLDLAVAGGDGWHRANGFGLSWRDPDQGAAAPIAAHRYRVTGAGGFDSGPVAGNGSGPISGVEVPAAGQYRVGVWLVDAAGNENGAAAVGATLRFDDQPPTGFFLEPDAEHPDRLRVPVADAHSGPDSGTISYRRQGEGDWHDLPTTIDGPEPGRELVASFPSDDLETGVYDLRARILDRAGNELVTTSRGNGSAMSLSAPRRKATELAARLATGGKSGLTIRVPYGKGARLTGRLTGPGGGGLASQPLRIRETPAFGARAGVVESKASTDREGHFSFDLSPGTSRKVSVEYRGTERWFGSSAGPLELGVTGSIRFRAIPRRLKTGNRVRFRGRVRSGWAKRPDRGSLVAIQYRDKAAKRWRPVLVTRTDLKGHIRASYRFRYITGRARIKLRVVLLESQYFPYATGHSRPITIEVRG